MMKKNLKIFAVVVTAATMLFASSCQKQEGDKPISETQLSIDNDDLQFTEFGDDEAITFSWQPVTYDGTVTYMLMITKAEDTGFAACVDTTTFATSVTLTSANVRDLANTLKADLSVGASFIAKVMATAGAGKTSYSNVVTFNAKKDNSGYETIYPIGAMDWEWDPSQAEAMHTDDGIVYTWSGNIKANNDFKFLCQNNGDWIPSYNRDGDAEDYWTLYKRTEDWQPDTCFKIEKAGRYKITLNIEELTISVVPDTEGFAKLYPIGAMAWGWNLESAEEMTTNDGITYTWTGHIDANLDFKFECQNTTWQPSYNRDANAGDYWTAYYRTEDWEPDTQWKVEISGEYKLTINIETLVVTAEPQFDPSQWEHLYPIGAMSWAWDPSQAEEMTTQDGVTYTWTGNITANNGFKFLCQNDGTWQPSYNRDSSAESYWTAYKRTEDWQSDDCFEVTESGKYTLTVNIQTLEVSAEKVIEKPGIYPVGGSFPCGWDNTLAEPMMTWNDEDYYWAGWLNVGTFKLLCYKDQWVPSYNRDPGAEYYWTMIYRNDGSADDTLFDITEAGQYIINLNTRTLEISCIKDHTFDFDPLYPIGAMSWAWDPAQAERMTTQDGETYEWIGEIKANNGFKFLCQNDGTWQPSYNRDASAESYWTAFNRTEDWQSDDCFEVTEGGIYKLTINKTTLAVSAERLGDVR